MYPAQKRSELFLPRSNFLRFLICYSVQNLAPNDTKYAFAAIYSRFQKYSTVLTVNK